MNYLTKKKSLNSKKILQTGGIGVCASDIKKDSDEEVYRFIAQVINLDEKTSHVVLKDLIYRIHCYSDKNADVNKDVKYFFF